MYNFIIKFLRLLLFSTFFIYMGFFKYANNIPFIFHNQLLVTMLIGYFILGFFLIFLIRNPNVFSEIGLKRFEWKAKNLAYCLVYLLLPLGLGHGFSSLAPIAVNIYASELSTKVFTVINLERRTRAQASIYDVYIIDAHVKKSFFLNSAAVAKLNLKASDKLTVMGRNSYFGFVVDNVNGVEVN